MYNGFSYNKNIISINYFSNINKKCIKFVVIFVIFAILIFLAILFTDINVAFAQNELSVNNELETQIESLLGKADFSAFDDVLNIIEGEFNFFNNNSFKDVVSALISGNNTFSIVNFFDLFKILFLSLIKQILKPLLLILCIALLSNVFLFFKPDKMKNSMSSVIYYLCLSLIIIILVGLLKNVLDLCLLSINSIKKQVSVSFPIILGFLTTIGAVSSVSLYSPLISFFSTTVVKIFSGVLLSIFSFILTLSFVSKLVKNSKLDKMKNFFISSYKWIIGSVSSVFITFLSLQGVIAGTKDGLSVKAAKFAIKNYIPFLGGYISQGFDFIKAGNVLIKNAVGIVSIFLLIFTILKPVLCLCVLMLGLKLVAASVDVVDGLKIGDLLEDVSNALKFLIAIIIGISLLYFFIIFLCISTGNSVL